MRAAFTVDHSHSTTLRALNYSPAIEAFRRRAQTSQCELLGRLASQMGPAYGTVFTRLDCDPDFGVELLSQSDMFATEPAGRVIRPSSMPVADDHRIRRWQVLIAGAGTLGETELYGRSTIGDARIENKYVGPDAVALTFERPSSDLNLYTFAFLSTALGMRCVRSTSYGTKILRFRMDLLRNLPVPIKDERTIKRVAELVREAVRKRELHAVHITAARKPIESLPEVVEALAMCADRRKRCLSWDGHLRSLSAWNYASTGGALQYLSRKWQGRLSNVVEPDGCFYGPRYARIPCQTPFGVNFLSQRDVFLIRALPRRIVHPGCDNRFLFVPENCLLIAGQGQLQQGNLFGRVELGVSGARGCAVSEAVFRIKPKDDWYEVLYSFLSTRLGLALIRGAAVGTSVPKINPDLLALLPVPDIGKKTAQLIQAEVQAAVAAREQATSAETEAIRIIEEEVLPEWLA